MLVKMIEGAQKNWGAPVNWKKENGICGGLPTKLMENRGQYYWVSAWEPTPEELEMLNKGGSIYLWVGANPHPVVAMSVQPIQED